MKRRKWRSVFPVVVLLALLALVVPVFHRAPPPAVRDGFDRIEDGMTEGQVNELLGGTRGVYDESRADAIMPTASGAPGGPHTSWWYFPNCDVEVTFDENGRVTRKAMKQFPARNILQRALQGPITSSRSAGRPRRAEGAGSGTARPRGRARVLKPLATDGTARGDG